MALRDGVDRRRYGLAQSDYPRRDRDPPHRQLARHLIGDDELFRPRRAGIGPVLGLNAAEREATTRANGGVRTVLFTQADISSQPSGGQDGQSWRRCRRSGTERVEDKGAVAASGERVDRAPVRGEPVAESRIRVAESLRHLFRTHEDVGGVIGL